MKYQFDIWNMSFPLKLNVQSTDDTMNKWRPVISCDVYHSYCSVLVMFLVLSCWTIFCPSFPLHVKHTQLDFTRSVLSSFRNLFFLLAAFKRLSRLEGIIPALETSHALAYLEKLCPTLPDGAKVVLNCSGRGDKDVHTAIKHLKVWCHHHWAKPKDRLSPES